MTDLSKMTLSEKIAARPLKVKDNRLSTFIEPKKQEIMTAIREINIEGQFNPTDAELMYVASVFSAKKFLSLADVKAEDIDIIGRRELEDLNQKLKIFTDKMNAVKAFGLFDLIDKLSQEVNESDIGALWEKAVNAKPSLYAKFMSMFQPSYADRSISERVQNISVILKSKGASLGAKIDKIELDLRQHKREGDANGDTPSEVIEIDLEKVPADIDKILFNISIFEPATATFSEVYDTFVVIKDDSGKQYFKAHLTSDFNRYNAVNIGRIERKHDGWSFVSTGEGFENGINGVLGKYSK